MEGKYVSFVIPVFIENFIMFLWFSMFNIFYQSHCSFLNDFLDVCYFCSCENSFSLILYYEILVNNIQLVMCLNEKQTNIIGNLCIIIKFILLKSKEIMLIAFNHESFLFYLERSCSISQHS